jgi:multiple sugar transport system permease protein
VTTIAGTPAGRVLSSRPHVTPSRRTRRGALVPTLIIALGALYCLFPIIWVLFASTKTTPQLSSTFTFAPTFRGGFVQNLKQLSNYRGGEFWRWGLNTILYAGGGAAVSVAVSTAAGYALAKYQFRGRTLIFNTILAGVLLPQVVLAIPQYLLVAKVGLAGTYWSVFLPSVFSPFGIYLVRIYAQSAIPDEMLDAAKLDGAGHWRIFRTVALPTLVPGLITVFLLQFVAIWNNFLLPFIMLSNDRRFPLTLGLYTMLNQGVDVPSLDSVVLMGALFSIVPLIALFLSLQRFWRLDLITGGVKG